MAKHQSSVNRPLPVDPRPKNRLLAALPDAEFRRLRPHLQTIAIRRKQVLLKQGERLHRVYFPNGGVCSLTTVLPDGSMVEAAAVGDEGMLGIEALFNDDAVAPGDTLVQVPDTDVKTLRRSLAECSGLHDLLGRYAQVFIAQMMQSTACNALHQVQERCCCWLLRTHDRMHQHDFDLSHEFLAMMLGVRRQTVTVIAGTLQSAGLIRYTHGRVTILDRKGLEAASCECYQILRRHFDRLHLGL